MSDAHEEAQDPGAVDAELAGRVESLVERLEQLADPHAKQTAREALGAVLALHRVGLARVLERLPVVQLKALTTQPLVSSLLLLHDLHPADLPTRVKQAVDRVRPLLALNGASVTLQGDGANVRATLAPHLDFLILYRNGTALNASTHYERTRGLLIVM